MKAIVNVPKGSAYANRNGLTFEVKEVLSSLVALDIEGTTTDFSFKEVLIVDIDKEIETSWYGVSGSTATRILHNLRAYKEANGIHPYPAV